MKVAVLFSGGKDSVLALYKALRKFEVKALVSIFPKNPASWMFHYPNIRITKLQAKSMGIPIITKVTEGKAEEELEDLEGVLMSVKGIEGVVSGALASKYQKERIGRIASKLGIRSFAPLWGKDPGKHWKEVLELGFKVIITGVACEGLGREWLGRDINTHSLEELKKLSAKYKFHLGGEGGEFETLVLDGPVFRKRIEVKESEIEWDSKTKSGIFLVKKAVLV